MTPQIRIPESELIEVQSWAAEHIAQGVTDSEERTYEEGVYEAICWMLGETSIRPDAQ